MKDLGKKIKRLRKKKGLSELGLAYELDFPHDIYSRMEQGDMSVELQYFLRLALFYNQSATKFFDGLDKDSVRKHVRMPRI